MRKNALRLAGLLLVLGSLVSPPRPAKAQVVCNLLCIQGFHCCIRAGEAACCPDHP